MFAISKKPACLSMSLRAAALSLGIAAAMAASGQALAAVKEVNMASPADGLAYCQAGKQSAGDVAYIVGAGGLAQFGPGAQCAQQVPVKTKVKNTLYVKGKHVAECKLASPAQALQFCQSGAMGQYDIAYIDGKVGRTVSGPGYGCVVNFSSVSVGNAICK